VLTYLIDETGDDPSPERATLRTVRTQLCRTYRIPDPAAATNASALAQQLEDDDGVPLEE
jgi:hypothetical protein